jgi:acetyl-CoA carboxylase carboxyltransferase component
MPQHCGEKPAVTSTKDPIDRREERLADLLPESTRQSYDMYEAVKLIVDDGKILDIKPRWARNVITSFARIGGFPVGIVANNPKMLGGILDVNASDKAAHFMQICDAFNVPLVFLMDVPGFMVGSQVEHGGIIRHGAKMLHVMAAATVPKLTVVVRKGYGAGYYVMAGRAYEPDLLVAWPGAEISVMGAEHARHRRQAVRRHRAPPGESRSRRSRRTSTSTRSAQGLVDDVIDPRRPARPVPPGLGRAGER